MKAQIITPNGERIPVVPDEDGIFNLALLRELIGVGWFRVIKVSEEKVMVFNDLGIGREGDVLPPNPSATLLLNRGLIRGDVLLADAQMIWGPIRKR